ncbi:M24 family metallopeptidase [Eggerthia catenaformis]|uniref:M24 family metallopeptidase n=1 Tax=Eggerthia catenaformis TaxID=31973 RepID=UPI00047A57B9|nr:Xaa-Pro peptidase family protein [Eggerthia catenaformis]
MLHRNRIEKITDKMIKSGCDYLLITDPASIDYLLDYYNDPHERTYMMVLAKNHHHKLFLNKLFYLKEDLNLSIEWFSDTDDSLGMIADFIKEGKLIGVDKNMPARWLIPLMNTCQLSHFIVGSYMLDEVRGIKDHEEQKLMIQSSKINDKAMDQMKHCLSLNYSEKEMEPLLLDTYLSMGASGHSFEPIFGYGKNGADPHHIGDDTHLKAGDSIIVDMGCIYKGYCSDMTRTFFYKEVSDKQREVYELVLKAQTAAEAAVRPGVKLKDIDQIARDIITEGGYGAEFNHRLGHFIGRLCHEAGEVSGSSEIIAKEGMIFSIEPGIYIKGEFGVRIEDLVMVTRDGCRVLNSYPKELTVID